MCNYLCLLTIIFDSSTFFNFQTVYSGEFPNFQSQWYAWRNFLKKNLSRRKMESRSVHTYHMCVKPLNEGFIIPLISFSSLLTSIFWKVVWSYLSILPIKYDVHERRKQQKLKKPFKCSWWPEQNYYWL